MKIFMCEIFLILIFLSATIAQDDIVEYENNPNTGDGSYSYKFRSKDGTFRAESATVQLTKENKKYLRVEGMYGYVDPLGIMHYVKYVADDKGYRPTPVKRMEMKNFMKELPKEVKDKKMQAILQSLLG